MTKRFVFEEMGYPTKSTIKEIVAAIRDRGVKKCVVCSEPDMVRAGITRRMTGILDEAGVKYELCACDENDVPRGFKADSLIIIKRIDGNRSEIKLTALAANADSEMLKAVIEREKGTNEAQVDVSDVPFMDAVADILMTIPGSITNLLSTRREALAGAEA